jgi:hypothetical protein
LLRECKRECEPTDRRGPRVAKGAAVAADCLRVVIGARGAELVTALPAAWLSGGMGRDPELSGPCM